MACHVSVENVLRNWFVSGDLDVEQILSGSTCTAFSVKHRTEQYVLRCFSSEKRAYFEEAILPELSKFSITPELVRANGGSYCIQYEDNFYNLQRFVDGKAPSLSDERQVAAVAESVARLHAVFSKCKYAIALEDRFDTAAMLAKLKDFSQVSRIFPANVDSMKKCVCYMSALEAHLSKDCLIHGDLGSRNMIWDTTKLWVIDFGEVRYGDPHFDLAAIIDEMITECEDKDTFTHLFSVFRDSYSFYYKSIDMQKLQISLYLWYIRGALASKVYMKDVEKREAFFSEFCQRILRLEKFF